MLHSVQSYWYALALYSFTMPMESGQEKYEPLPRWGHVSVAIGDKMYLWGGRIENFSEDSQKKVSES